MKNILLTTTALVAFAGAAAADGHTSVSFSGGASAEYNSLGGFNTDADLDATMSAELDNGLSVSTKISIDTANYKGEATKSGSLTLSSDTASLTFGNDITSASFSAVGDTIGFGDGEDGIQGVIGSYTMGAGTLFVSMPIATAATEVLSTDIEVGVTAAVGGMTVGLAMANSDFVGKVSGTAAGLSYTVAAGSVADANRWDVAVSYPAGPVTVGYTVDDSEAWEVSAAYAEGGVAAELTYNSAESYDVEASYDMSNGLVVSAGMLNSGDDTYLGAAYSLGGGASAYASYVKDTGTQNADNEIGANDYARGTTVGVSFTF
ncbi:MAG: porin [Loktanella sp.]|nr:porin [Loktanella sp.]